MKKGKEKPEDTNPFFSILLGDFSLLEVKSRPKYISAERQAILETETTGSGENAGAIQKSATRLREIPEPSPTSAQAHPLRRHAGARPRAFSSAGDGAGLDRTSPALVRPAHAWTERRKEPQEAAGLVGSPGVLREQRLAEDARRGTAGCVGKVHRDPGDRAGNRPETGLRACRKARAG